MIYTSDNKSVYIQIFEYLYLCILTFIRHEYIQLYEYLYFNILTIIRVIIQSYQVCDMYNYMSTYT